MLSHHYVLISVLLGLTFLASAGIAVLEAYLDTRKRPREEMHWCNKHGPIRIKHCLELFPHMKQRNGKPFLGCPFCVAESFNKVGSMT